MPALRLLPKHPGLRLFAKVCIGVAAMFSLVVGGCAGSIKLAEWRAQSFCDGIALGSDIAPAIQRFELATGKPGVRHYGETNGTGHVFMFPFSMMDRAYCAVSLTPDGHVVAKTAYTLYD